METQVQIIETKRFRDLSPDFWMTNIGSKGFVACALLGSDSFGCIQSLECTPIPDIPSYKTLLGMIPITYMNTADTFANKNINTSIKHDNAVDLVKHQLDIATDGVINDLLEYTTNKWEVVLAKAFVEKAQVDFRFHAKKERTMIMVQKAIIFIAYINGPSAGLEQFVTEAMASVDGCD